MSIPFHVRLREDVYRLMVFQALAERPNECCGLLGGKIATAGATLPAMDLVRCYPLVNEAGSPSEYFTAGASLFAAHRNMRDLGLDLLGIYHSHPTSEPVPSRKDLERNYYGDQVVHFIISLKAAEPLVRGWWLGANDFREAEWKRGN